MSMKRRVMYGRCWCWPLGARPPALRSTAISSATTMAEFWGGAIFVGSEARVHGRGRAASPDMGRSSCRWSWAIVGGYVAWLFYIRRPDIPASLAKTQDGALPVPAEQVVFRRALRLPVRQARHAARARPVEGRRRRDHRRLRARRRVRACAVLAARARQLQTGYLYHYAFAMLIGVAAIMTWYVMTLARG